MAADDVSPDKSDAGAKLYRPLVNEDDFERWCLEVIDALTPQRERFTPFPRYFEVQCFNFATARRVMSDLFRLDRPYNAALEIGCGVGAHSVLLSRFARKLTAIDIPGELYVGTNREFRSAIQVARHVGGEIFKIPHLSFVEAYPYFIPLPDQELDLIFTWTVLEHIPDLPRGYKEMVRVLKPGGQMIHVVPNTMSAIHTMAGVNVDAAKRPPIKHEPLGYLGAARHLWREFKELAHGYEEPMPSGWTIPQCHSEFLTNYNEQLELYISWNYLAPLQRLGMIVENLVTVNDFNYALVLRKPD